MVKIFHKNTGDDVFIVVENIKSGADKQIVYVINTDFVLNGKHQITLLLIWV
jgi:hypothetical protein